MIFYPRHKEGEASQRPRELRLAARLRLREHGLRVRPHGADLDAAIGGDLGERLAGHDADRDIRLGPGEPERLRRRDRNSGLLGRWTKQSDAAINPARMWV